MIRDGEAGPEAGPDPLAPQTILRGSMWRNPRPTTVTIVCADYPAHELEHRRLDGRWVCERCALGRQP